MINFLTVKNDSVLALEAEGKVTVDDYKAVIIPAMENKLRQHKKIRLLYELGSQFSGFDLQAMGEDIKLGIHHWADLEKIALVSDVQWIRILAKLFALILPYPVKIFDNNQLLDAEEWISS